MDDTISQEMAALVLRAARDDNQRYVIRSTRWYECDTDTTVREALRQLKSGEVEKALMVMPGSNLLYLYASEDRSRAELVWDTRRAGGHVNVPVIIPDAETGEPLTLLTFSADGCDRWPITMRERVFVEMTETRARQESTAFLDRLQADSPTTLQRLMEGLTAEQTLARVTRDILEQGEPDLVNVTAGLMQRLIDFYKEDMRRDETLDLVKGAIESIASSRIEGIALAARVRFVDKSGASIDQQRWYELRGDLSYSRIQSHKLRCPAIPSVTIEWAVEWIGVRLPPDKAIDYVVASHVITAEPPGTTIWRTHGTFADADEATRRLAKVISLCEANPDALNDVAQRLLDRIAAGETS